MLYQTVTQPVLPALIEREFGMPEIVLFDVGCSHGLPHEWTPLMPWLRAYGFDPLVSEIERLNAEAAGGRYSFHDGYVVGPPRPPALAGARNTSWFGRTSATAAIRSLQMDYTAKVINRGPELVFSDKRF